MLFSLGGNNKHSLSLPPPTLGRALPGGLLATPLPGGNSQRQHFTLLKIPAQFTISQNPPQSSALFPPTLQAFPTPPEKTRTEVGLKLLPLPADVPRPPLGS